MRVAWIAPLVIVAAAPAMAQTPAEARVAIDRAMADSDAGWNSGDLDRFMALYSDSPETTYITTEGLVRGKAAIAARYAPRFTPEMAAKRGKLGLEVLDFRMIGADHALVTARYVLTYADGETDSGPTTLLFRREAAGWRIVADHSG